MKKCWILLLAVHVFLSSNNVFAQSQPTPFFLKNGTVAFQTRELGALADSIAVVNHRWDDIVWSRTVYRIIDMRDKQNYQLYFPLKPTNEYRSLFRVILDAVVKDTLQGVANLDGDVSPLYNTILNKDSLLGKFEYLNYDTASKKILDRYPIIKKDDVTQKLSIDDVRGYPSYVKDQLKYVIQEFIFFDKHTSRLYSKIIAIAPVYSLTEINYSFENRNAWDYLTASIPCWFLYDELRPYLIRQYVIPDGNNSQRLSYDDFFSQKLYSSYILGENNDRGWLIPRYLSDPEKIRKEQQRIETELLNFEQDLWEY